MPDQATRDSGDQAVERRTVLRALAGGAAVGSLGLSGTAIAQEQSGGSEGAVTILHDTHFHGRFGDPADESEMDIARYYSLVEERRSARDDAVFLGIGDDIAPSLMGLAYEGEHMIEALNYADPLAVGVGNHEFDFGVDVATDRFGESEFPWVVANLLTPDDEPIPGTQRWITREVGDVTLGIFGSGVADFYGITDYPDEYGVLDPVEASREATRELKEAGADIVILASHASTETHPEIAEAVDDLDAIVGSHSEVVMEEPEEVSGTIISEFGDEFDHLAELTLDADGNLVDFTRHDPTPEDLTPDEGMADIVSQWRDSLVEDYGDEFFRSEVELDARFSQNYARETRIGNLIGDLFLEYAADVADAVDEADVALQNAGGIRSNSVLGPGGITGLDWLDVLPFPNTIVTLEVGGDVLHEVLESQVDALPDASFGAQQAVQVAGIQYEWTGHFGERSVDDVYVQGEPLDPDETYTLVTNDYVAGWDQFEDSEVVHESDDFMGFIFLDMLEGRTVAPEIEGRILRVDADAGDPKEVVRRGGETKLRYGLPDAVAALADQDTFYAVTNEVDRLTPERVAVESGDLWVTFRTGDLQSFVGGRNDLDLRVFGGFDPDESYYDYRNDDDELLDLPVAAAWDHFVLKAPVPVDAIRGGGNGNGGGGGGCNGGGGSGA